MLEEALFTLGPLAAGGLAATAGPAVALLAAAGLGVVGTALFVAAPVAGIRAGRQADRVGWAGAMAGRGLRTLVASLVGVGAAVRVWELGLVGAASLEGSPARNDPRASLDAQRIEASLLRAAGRAPEQPLKDPSPWLGRSGSALLLRWRAGQAFRAALFADPRTALYATLEPLRYLPGDPWMAIRAAALAVLQSGSATGPPDAPTLSSPRRRSCMRAVPPGSPLET